MATTSAQTELIEQERRFWQALKENDVATMVSMSAEPCVVAGAQGVATIDRKTFERMMSASQCTLEAYELVNPQVSMIRDDVGIVSYQVREELTLGAEKVKLEAADTSVWVRRDGRWLCALHTESLSGDPFGRDRRK